MTRPRILLIEDNPADVGLVQEALSDGALDVDLILLSDGQQALDFLDEELAHLGATDVIILDLNLPRASGWEVLIELRRHPIGSVIPVIVLTSSESESDAARLYALGAQICMTKPMRHMDFVPLLRNALSILLK